MLHSLVSSVEDGASVHVLSVVLRHCLGPRLWRENSLVAVVLQFRFEEVVELIRLDLLETDDVSRIVANFVQYCLGDQYSH